MRIGICLRGFCDPLQSFMNATCAIMVSLSAQLYNVYAHALRERKQ